MCIGRAKIACNIQDEAAQPQDPTKEPKMDSSSPPAGPPDMHFEVHLEDLSLFLGWQSSPADSVCLSDLDFIDLNVHSSQSGGKTDVQVSGNLLNVRTCPDGLVLLGELVKSMFEERSRLDPDSNRDSRETSVEPVREDVVDEDSIVPDLADAMEELDSQEERERRRARRAEKQKQKEEQVTS